SGRRITPWVSLPRKSASTIKSATTVASSDRRPAASKARLMEAANAPAAMRGTSASFAVLGSVATCPDMCTPICTSRYVISIEDRLQPAFFALTSAPRDRRDPNRHPLAPCRGTVGRHQPAILSFEAGHVLIVGAARSGWNRSSHGSLSRHGRYRRDIFGFRLSQRRNRGALDREAALDARRSIARDPCRRRGAVGNGWWGRRHRLFLPPHHRRAQPRGRT